MNALWLERMTTYKSSSCALESARVILEFKITHQSTLLRKYELPQFTSIHDIHSINELLLLEARAAKHFWKQYKRLVPEWANFPGRRAASKDVTNMLLDIGYHHLTGKVKKLLEQHNIPLAPALFHIAHTEKSMPLVYDLMELFRSDIVDAEVLRYLRLKKKPIVTHTQRDIGRFVHRLNKRLDKKYFLRDFKQCHTYRYYMELQLLKFIKAVNRKEIFEPLLLPERHDTRCTCKK